MTAAWHPARQERYDLPKDLSAERGFLSAFIVSARELWEEYHDFPAENFFHPGHQVIWRAIHAILAENKPLDLVLLSEHLERQNLLDAAGGYTALTDIAILRASPESVPYYAEILQEAARKREIIAASYSIQDKAYEKGVSALEALSFAQAELSKIELRMARRHEAEPISDVAQRVQRALAEAREHGLSGHATGYTSLDKKLFGIHKGEIVIIGARPKVGKSTLAMNLAWRQAAELGYSVGFISLEMTKEQLAQRLIQTLAHMPRARLYYRGQAVQEIERAVTMTLDKTLFLDESDGSLDDVVARMRTLVLRHKCEIVYIDYFNLIHAPGYAEQFSQQMYQGVLWTLKRVQGSLQAPQCLSGPTLFIIAQLSRKVEDRRGGQARPRVADYRDTGALEQIGDKLIALYRPFFHDKEGENENILEVGMLRDRHGESDYWVKLAFLPEEFRIEDLAEDPEPDKHDLDIFDQTPISSSLDDTPREEGHPWHEEC